MRSFLAVCMVAGALCAWGEDYTTTSYVQDGLVAQWDGFDNTGTGTHDFTATTWKNLKTSGGDLQLSGCSWGLGGVVIDTVGSPLVCTETFSPALEAGTIEVLIEYTSVSPDCRRWDQYGEGGAVSGTCGTWTESNHNYYKEGFGDSKNGGTSIQFGQRPNQFGVRLSFVTTYNTTNGAHTARVYMSNSWRKGNGTNMSGTSAFPTRFQFARNAGIGSRVYAIRIYNRILTDAEIEANRQVDAARYTDDALTARWKVAVDGDWKTATNWSSGIVPFGGIDAYLTAEGADHTVRFHDTGVAFPAFTHFYNPSGLTTLDIRNGVTNDIGTASFNVMTGGVMKVAAGSGIVSTGSLHATDEADVRLAVHGGTVLVEGGDVMYTNLYGKAVVDGSESQTGMVRVTGGRFSWQALAKNRLYLNRYGCLSVTNGLCEIWNGSLTMDNGVIDVSETGTFAIRGKSYYTLGSGLYRFRDKGRFKWTSAGGGADRHTFIPSRTGERIDLEFLDEVATVDNSDQLTMGQRKGGEINVKVDTTKTVRFGNTTVIGDKYGVTRLTVLKGTAQMDMYGFRVGSSYRAATTDAAVTGIVTVAGGTFTTGGSSYNKDGGYLAGCVIGDGTYLNLGNYGKTHYFGGLYLSAGRVSHGQTMPIFVGAGPTTQGEIVQTGGAFTNSASGSRLVLGLAGGTGSYVISNGLARVAGQVYLGGQFTNALNSCKMANYPVNVHGGTGTLRVDGGSFRVDQEVYSGVEGNGVIAIGPSGTLDLRGDVILSNATTTAGLDFPRTSQVTFTFGPDGCGCIDFTQAAKGKGVITAEAGAKLTVDATAYEGKTARWPLVRLGASTPSLTTGDTPVFASDDVTVLGDDVRLVEGTYRGVNALWAVFDRGAVLLVR